RTLQRRKHGFVLPIGRWLRNDLRDYVRDLFASTDDPFYDHVSRREVNRILGEFYGSGLDRALPLWVLLWLKIWCRQVARQPGAVTGKHF
ncbi:MAG: asparagine synthase-related protein, partial [Acidobacteria bacterium]|nr:asparagine synthase-related protein [Acidobacteriota bacterium]